MAGSPVDSRRRRFLAADAVSIAGGVAGATVLGVGLVPAGLCGAASACDGSSRPKRSDARRLGKRYPPNLLIDPMNRFAAGFHWTSICGNGDGTQRHRVAVLLRRSTAH